MTDRLRLPRRPASSRNCDPMPRNVSQAYHQDEPARRDETPRYATSRIRHRDILGPQAEIAPHANLCYSRCARQTRGSPTPKEQRPLVEPLSHIVFGAPSGTKQRVRRPYMVQPPNAIVAFARFAKRREGSPNMRVMLVSDTYPPQVNGVANCVYNLAHA